MRVGERFRRKLFTYISWHSGLEHDTNFSLEKNKTGDSQALSIPRSSRRPHLDGHPASSIDAVEEREQDFMPSRLQKLFST